MLEHGILAEYREASAPLWGTLHHATPAAQDVFETLRACLTTRHRYPSPDRAGGARGRRARTE